MNDILNPYIAGAPVVESRMFFGREDVFSWIERSLAGRYVDHILVLHGQRRVGKTSVLKQIPNYLPEKYIQVFFDLQGRTNTTLDRFLWWLARDISRTLSQVLEIDIPRPDREVFANDPEYLINQFLPSLKSILGDKVLLLTFDEFDTLDQADIRRDFAKPLIGILNRLIQIEYINFIFSIGSSGDKLENMQASYTEFFKSALYRKISFLTRYDCQRLITRPVEDVINYDKKAVDRIYSITSGHPYFTQLMCHELFSMCQKTGKREIELIDVESILNDVIERGTVNLKFVWDEANDLEKWVLAGLAHLEGLASTGKLAQLLTAQHVRFSDSDLSSAIIHLQDKDVLTSENQFVVYLMYLWLQVNRPLDRVREELVEVNPIVNRYIEIGDEYRDLGQFDRAIESYQQALSIDTENLKAHSSIAELYMESGDYLKAASKYELALQIDDEDIAVQSGYCQANLVLGNEARKTAQIDEATRYYQKILMVNPAHNDGRYQLAEIFQVQAEEFLTNGQDEEALSKFNAAVELMPDDDELVARYQDVLEQKKTKVIASWLMEYERAQKNQRWDDAINAIKEALKLSPDDPNLLNMLASAEKSRHQFELARWKQKASVAAKDEKWDQAIQAWGTYLALNPDDRQEAQDALANAQKYHLIAKNYARAQELMQERRYQDAIELLQGIIAQDPTYKSASKLLAEAVRAHIPAPITKRPLLYVSMALVVIVFAGIFFWPQISQFLPKTFENIGTLDFVEMFLSNVTENPFVSVTDDSSDTLPANLPTLIPTQDPQAYIQPVLDKSANMLPTFEEDFSKPQGYWDSLVVDDDQNFSFRISDLVSDGVLRVEDEPTEQTGYSLTTYLPDDQASDFRLQFDFRPVKFNYPTKLQIHFRDYLFEISPSGEWILESNNGVDKIEGYATVFKMDQVYQFQVIAGGNHLMVMLNDQILAYLEDDVITVDHIGIRMLSYFPFKVEIDNIKYWNLDNYDNVLALTGPILDYIAVTPPDFEDDFSMQQPYWNDPVNDEFELSDLISNGILSISDESAEETFYVMKIFPEEQFDDFNLQYDFTPIEFSDNSTLRIAFRSKEPEFSNDSGDYEYEFSINNGGLWGFWLVSDDENITLAEGKTSPLPPGQVYHFNLIALGNKLTVTLNDKLLAYAEDNTYIKGGLSINLTSYGPTQVEFDNIKIWNLDGLELDLQGTSTPESEVDEQRITYTPEPEVTEQQVTNTPETEIADLLYKRHVFDSAISDLAWSDNHFIGNLVAVSGLDDRVVILRGTTGQETRNPINSQYQIAAVDWNPDGGGDRLAIGDVSGLVSLYRKVQYPGSPEGPKNIDSLVGNGEITELSFGEASPGVDFSATTSNGYIAVWNTTGDQGALVWKKQIDLGSILSLDWNLVNHQILTVSENEGIQVFNADNGGRLLRLNYLSLSAAWSPDGKYFSLEDHSSGSSSLIVVKSGAEQTRLELPESVNKIAWSPDGKMIAAAGKDGNVWLISGQDDSGQIQSLEILSTYELDAEVTDLVWSPESDVILTGDINGNIWAWQVH